MDGAAAGPEAAGAAAAGAILSLDSSYARGDVGAFLDALKAALDAGTFPGVRDELAAVGARNGAGFGHFALKCLPEVAGREQKQWVQVGHLLAQAGPAGGEALEEPRGDALGAALESLAATSGALKLVATALRAWSVCDAKQLGAQTRKVLAAAVLQEVQSGGASVAAAAGVATVVPSLLSAEASCELVRAVDDGHRDDVVERLVRALGRDAQLKLVAHRKETSRLRAAARSVKEFKLDAEFPEVELEWRTEALASAVKHKSREAAVGLCFEEPRLHAACVEGLLVLGEAELAVDLASAWGVSAPREAEVAAAEARERSLAEHLCPPSGFVIHTVDNESAVPTLQAALLAARTVGLDAEWAPGVSGTPPTLLQLATVAPPAAYLVDLVALGGSASLGAALEAVLSSASVTKVGFDGAKDLGRIFATLPALGGCSKKIEALVDLRVTEAARRRQAGTPKKQALEGLSLSSLAEKYVARPLNKALQMSHWGHRPLSAAQAQYAALDAWVCAEIYERQLAAEGSAAAAAP